MAHKGGTSNTRPSPSGLSSTSNPQPGVGVTQQSGAADSHLTESQAMEELKGCLHDTLTQLNSGIKAIDKLSEAQGTLLRAAREKLRVQSNWVEVEHQPGEKRTGFARALSLSGQGVGASGSSSGQEQEARAVEGAPKQESTPQAKQDATDTQLPHHHLLQDQGQRREQETRAMAEAPKNESMSQLFGQARRAVKRTFMWNTPQDTGSEQAKQDAATDIEPPHNHRVGDQGQIKKQEAREMEGAPKQEPISQLLGQARQAVKRTFLWNTSQDIGPVEQAKQDATDIKPPHHHAQQDRGQIQEQEARAIEESAPKQESISQFFGQARRALKRTFMWNTPPENSSEQSKQDAMDIELPQAHHHSQDFEIGKLLDYMEGELAASLAQMKQEWGNLLDYQGVRRSFERAIFQLESANSIAALNIQDSDSLLKEENESLKAELSSVKATMDAQQNASLEAELANVKATMDEQVRSLKEKLRQAEQENRKTRGGAHVDTGALPPALEEAAKAVKNRLDNLASEVNDRGFADRLSFPRDEEHSLEHIDSMEFTNNRHRVRYRTAYVISTLMFRGFEIDGFDSTKGYFCPRLDPEEAASDSFTEFQTLKELFDEDLSFFDKVVEGVKAKAAADGNRFQHFAWQKFRDLVPAELLEEACGLPQFLDTFVLLAFAVWQLQRLALSFHPNAKIFRVPCGAEFDHRYMEKIEDNGEEQESATGPPKVGFMVVPGFRLGKIIIKSEVYPQRT